MPLITKQHNKLVCPLSQQNFYEKPAFDYPLNQMSVWLMLGNEGMERESNNSFCASTPSAMVFGRSDGDRVAVTRDLALRSGYTLQFKVSVKLFFFKDAVLDKRHTIITFFSLPVEHRLRIRVQRVCSSHAAVLSRCRAHLGAGPRGLLPRNPGGRGL